MEAAGVLPARAPLLTASARLGRIHFAGTDAAWMAYADRAIDTAHRVAAEIAGSRRAAAVHR